MTLGMLVLLTMASLLGWMSAMERPNGKAKRIAFGEPIPSLGTYEIYFYVLIRRQWACLSDQTDHEGSLGRCQIDIQQCGGTLIHPEFIMTAAHCLMYWQVYVIDKDDKDEPDQDAWVLAQRKQLGSSVFSAIQSWEKFQRALESYFVDPKPKHTVYSEWALLMGSHDSNKMTQKRHAVKLFPHREFPKIMNNVDYKAFEAELNTWHDIALVRACQPFTIKPGEVQIAPLLKSEAELRLQYENVVKTSKVCLYVGFGRQDNALREVQKAGYTFFPENLMMHTWRHSGCYMDCNIDYLSNLTREHPCVLCSYHLGFNLGTNMKGDSGSPVTCEGKVVATFTKFAISVSHNLTRVDSYPVHCLSNAIDPKNLEYLKTVPHGGDYHALVDTRWRRLAYSLV